MTIQLDTLVLSDNLIWSDETSSYAVAQTMRRALDGSPVVFYAGQPAGRSITLQSAADTGWLTRDQIEALLLLAASPGAVYSLTIRAQTFTVMFRHHDAPAVKAEPLWPYSNPQPGDYYTAILKFITL